MGGCSGCGRDDRRSSAPHEWVRNSPKVTHDFTRQHDTPWLLLLSPHSLPPLRVHTGTKKSRAAGEARTHVLRISLVEAPSRPL